LDTKKTNKNITSDLKETAHSYHHGNLREQLLISALEVLIEKGVSGISLREVAKRAGVSHGAPYRHFKDKNVLLLALAQEGFSRLASELRHLVKLHQADPQQQLIEAGVVYVRLAVSSPELTQLMFGGILNYECSDGTDQAAGESAFQELLNIIVTGQSAGVYKDEDSMSIALACWSSMHGLAMLYSAGQLDISSDKFNPEDLIRMISRMLMQGLLK